MKSGFGRTFKGVLLAVLLICVAVIVSLYLHRANVEQQIEVQQEYRDDAIAKLERDEGTYDAQSIVLYNTSYVKATELAEKFGASLRMNKDSTFATLTLPEGTTILDVYRNEENLAYLEQMSADYQVRISDLVEGEEDEQDDARLPMRPTYAVSDTDYGQQTYLDYMNLQNVWASCTGSGITVAVIDTGIDTDHPEFAGRISEYSYNATEDKIVKDYVLANGEYDWSLVEDEQGHGTAVTGVIAAAMDGAGTVGIAPDVTIITIKAECNEDGIFERTSDLVFGLYYAIECDVSVVNMSFGGYSDENPYEDATQLAYDSDIICIAAAGNDGSTDQMYPAADQNVFGIGALEANGWALASYSNYGENVNFVAPGTTYTTQMGGEYGTVSGTSLASPAVAGVMALYLSRNRYATFDQVEESLYASCYDLGDLGCDWYYGYGAIDASALILESRGKVTFNMMTDELENTEQIFIRDHTLQNIPEPERLYAVFDGWYYDPYFTEEYNWYADEFSADLTLYAHWVNEEDGIPYTYVELDDGTIEIRSYTGRRSYIKIPDTIEGKTVTRIGREAFLGQTRLREVTLPSNLREIGPGAFRGCSNLLHIEIPDTVTCIDEGAFYDNVRLSYVAFGQNSQLTQIGSQAFKNCAKLLRMEIPSKLTTLDGSAFEGTTNLIAYTVKTGNTSFVAKNGVLFNATGSTLVAYPAGVRGTYTIPASVRYIGNAAFAYARMESIDLSGIEQIGNNAFVNAALRSVTIPDSVTALGGGAFQRAPYLTTVKLGNGLKAVPSGAFKECFALSQVELSANIRSIEGSAFEKTFALSSVTFAENSALTEIEQNAFLASGLRSIRIPASVISIGNYAFCSTKLNSVVFEQGSQLRMIGDNAFYGAQYLTQIELPEYLEQIGAYAFRETGLTAVSLPASVSVLKEGVFASCRRLTRIDVADQNPVYCDVNGVVYDKSMTMLIAYPAGATATSYTVPQTVTVIGEAAFFGTQNLRSVELPSALCEIRREAFYDCAVLNSMHIPANVVQISNLAFAYTPKLGQISFDENSKLPRISYQAFAYSGITNLRVPASVTSIAQGAFEGCSKLRLVTFASGSKLPTISAYMFSGCTNLMEIRFEQGSALTSIQAHGLEGMRNLYSIDFGDAKLTNIDNFAFRFCERLTSFTIPEGVTYLGRYAFYNCTSLESVTLPDSIEYVGEFAFLGTKPADVYFSSETLPAYLQENWDHGVAGYYLGVSEIMEQGDWTYAKLSDGSVAIVVYNGTASHVDLTALDFGGKIVNIGGSAFENSSVKSIVLPDSLVTIQAEAFYRSALLSVTIPASVQFIGRSAFADTPLQTLTFEAGASLSVIERSAFENTKSLRSVSLPASLKTMGSASFKNSGISSLTFEAGIGLTEIAEEAFAYTNLVSLSLPDTVNEIGASAFRETVQLKTVAFGSATELMIMSNAFYHAGLTSLHIPANVAYIGEYAFVALPNLQSISVDASNLVYRAEDGLLLSKDGRKLIVCPAGREGTLTVPESVEIIGFGAFEDSKLTSIMFSANANILSFGYRAFYNSQITQMHVPASVVTIDYYAFAMCKNLSRVTFASGSQLCGVYEGAFYGCRNLTEIALPDTVKEIAEFAFYGCGGLEKIPVSASTNLKGIYDYAFAYTGIEGVLTMPESLVDIGAYAFQGNRLTEVIIPNTNAYDLVIGLGAFAGCNELTEITVPFIGASFEDPEITWFGYIFGAGGYEANATYVPQSLVRVTVHEGISTVGKHAFDGITCLEEIDLPHSITLIEDYAFNETTARYELTNTVVAATYFGTVNEKYKVTEWHFGTGLSGHLQLSDVVTEINYGAFRGSKNLESVSTGDGVTVISPRTFADCTALTKVILGERLTTIDFQAFEYCESLVEISIPDSVRTIGNRAFSNCISLREISIPEGVTKIEWSTFGSCFDLRCITIPQSMEVIETGAFSSCDRLYTVYNNSDLSMMPGSDEHGYITRYAKQVFDREGNRVFKDPSTGATYITTEDGFRFEEKNGQYTLVEYFGDLETVTLPTDIMGKSYAIRNMFGVKKVIIPEGVTEIGTGAFWNCYTLVEITLPDSIKEIKPNAFYNCSSLEKINFPEGVTHIGHGAFFGCASLERITFPQSLTIIDGNAFHGCIGLDRIEIPKNIQSIDSTAFANCTFHEFTIDPENEHFTLLDGIIYDKDITQIIYVPDDITEVCIPKTVTYFPYMFQGKTKLTKVTFEQGTQCTSISQRAFEGCTSLVSVEIPVGVTQIEDGAFCGCTSLTEVVIPEGVTSIAVEAFKDCESLTDVTIPQSLTYIGFWAFYDCYAIKNVYISDLEAWCHIDCDGYGKNPVYFGADMYLNGELLTKVEFPNTITEIKPSIFNGCTSIREVVIPEGVKAIRDSAFHHCVNLTHVTLPEGLEILERYAFLGCQSLKDVVIPDSVKSIEEGAFRQCGSLTEIELGSGLENLGGSVFMECPNLLKVTIPDQITEISDSLFSDCPGLAEVDLGEGVTKIGICAFRSCGLTRLTIPSGVTEIGENAFDQCYNLVVIENHSELPLTVGSADYGEIAYSAKMITDRDGNVTYRDPAVGFECIETEDGFRFIRENGQYTLVAYLGSEETVTLPADISGNPYRIYYMSGVRNVIIPEGITEIGQYAFRDCTTLQSVIISDSVTHIGNAAFYGCSSLSRITIGSGVTEIHYSAFERTAYYDDPSNWENGALYIGNCLIKVSPDAVCFEQKPNTQMIAARAFDGCYSLKEVIIGGNGLGALSGVTNLERLMITELPTEHGISGYFSSGSGSVPMTLKTVVLKESVTMQNHAFGRVKGVTIYVEGLESDLRWDANYPLWHNDNRVVYSDKWIVANFYDENGDLFSNEIFLTSQVIRQPELITEKGQQYSKVLIGWDLDGDGIADSVPATSTLDLHAYPVFETRATTYTVRFYAEDGATLLAKMRLPYGSEIVPPEVAEKQGYTMRGWSGYTDGMTVRGDHTFILEREHIGGKHVYADAVWCAPTCTEQGCYKAVCTVCGEWIGTDFVPATGHAYSTEITPPTCFADGSILYTCASCGDRYTEILPCEGHDFSIEKTVAATCTEQGTVYSRCTACGAQITESVPISEHTYQKTVVTHEWMQNLLALMPKIFYGNEDDGAYYFACVDCGYIQHKNDVGQSSSSSVNDVCSHVLGAWSVIESATCLTPEVQGRVCSLCQKLLEMQILPGTESEHDYDSGWTVDVEPTCTEAGSKSMYCSWCGTQKDITAIPALGHDDSGEWHVDSQPTCTVAGSKSLDCTRCSEQINVDEIPATGHTAADAVEENRVEPSCTEIGGYDMVTYCATCGEELGREHVEIPATGHTAADAVEENRVEPSCTEIGGYDMVTYCATCGEEL
ncbi:MAG: leucine-rich repeat protein, partial [Clostridia bacterium]|nr:leucine-rich repeat protein [Clostridia bacterium]